MANVKIGDKVCREDAVGTVVGFNEKGGAVVERGDFYNLTVEPKDELVIVPKPNE